MVEAVGKMESSMESATDKTDNAPERSETARRQPSFTISDVNEDGETSMDLSKRNTGLLRPYGGYNCYVNSAHGPVIMPDSPFGQCWDLCAFGWIVYTCFVGTFEFAFIKVIQFDTLFMVNRCADIFFLCDMIKSTRTSYLLTSARTKRYETDTAKIRTMYLRTWFLPDVLATFPFDLITYIAQQQDTNGLMGPLKFFRILRLFKLVRIVRSLRVVRVSMQPSPSKPTLNPHHLPQPCPAP